MEARMKTLVSVIRAAVACAFALLVGVAKLLVFFLAPAGREDQMDDRERGAGVLGRNDIAPFDYGPGSGDAGDYGYTGYTAHGREPIAVGRNGERVGAYSGDPIIHF
jgi:hypothetical protein